VLSPARLTAAVLITLASLALGFVAGAWWHAGFALERPQGPAVAPIALPRRVAPSPELKAVGTVAPSMGPAALLSPRQAKADAHCAEVVAALTAVRGELQGAKVELESREEKRLQQEGAPISSASQPKESNEPRFAPQTLRTAVSGAFVEVGVPGRVDGLDCTEWPCIVYGRIRGSEDEMEKLEGAKALAAYQRDVLAVLLWVVTDEGANAAPLPGLPGLPEQSLYAFAWYPRGLERSLAENLDKRLRSRTAELWNTVSPADETGR
jgi:hypothetical protein